MSARRQRARRRPVSYLLSLLAAVALLPSLSGSVDAQIQAGVASAEITPPLGGRLYGYGARGANTSTTVHDPLFAKAIVLREGRETVAIVALDLGSIRRVNTERIRQLVVEAAGFSNVLLTASHTHSAPSFQADFPTADAPWIAEMEAGVAEVVVAAHADLGPALFAVGQGTAHEGHNRRRIHSDGTVEMLWENREGVETSPTDPSVGVLAVDRPDGSPVATLVNYACHPVILGPDNLAVSADYVGVLAGILEATGSGQTMFLQGAAGDINPYWDKTPLADGAFDQVRAMGQRLALEVLRVRERLQGEELRGLRSQRDEIQMQPRWDFSSPALEARFRDAGASSLLERYRSRFVAEQLAEIDVVTLSDELALGFFPGEFFVEHGLRFRAQSLASHTFFVGYANGELAYFPTIRAAAEGGYGATEATMVAVGSGEALVSRALVLIHELLGRGDLPTY